MVRAAGNGIACIGTDDIDVDEGDLSQLSKASFTKYAAKARNAKTTKTLPNGIFIILCDAVC